MPRILHTPESLLPRSDSKNPATTCKGITAAGRPCRRSLASSPRSVVSATDVPGASFGLTQSHGSATTPNGQFCWQHKDQAQAATFTPMSVKVLKSRNSFDTVLEQFDVLQIHDKPPVRRKKYEPATTRYQEPLCEKQGSKPLKSKSVFSLLLCWAPVDDDEYLEIVRHKTRVSKSKSTRDEQKYSTNTDVHTQRKTSSATKSTAENHNPVATTPKLFHVNSRTPVRAQDWQHFIPPSLPPSVQAQLMAEMAKPISVADEDGYIYLFWLTDSKADTPAHLKTFLDSQGSEARNARRHERTNITIRRTPTASHSPPTMHNEQRLLIKIGRATNVHRRLATWTQQCGYKLSLVRFYPHVGPSTAATGSPLRSPNLEHVSGSPNASNARKVPFSHRVERLIHIELSSQQVQQGRCPVCGKAHREWFEVDASREGLRRVDEVVKRWVQWAESLRESQGV